MRESRKMYIFLLLLAPLALSSGPVLALDFQGVDLRPHVVVQEICLQLPDPENPQIPLGSSKADQVTTVSAGGAVTSSLAIQVQRDPYQGGFLQGLASPAERAAFSAAVNTARLGSQATCKVLLACSGGGQTTVTWFGRNNSRRNSFTIVDSDSPANDSIPDCPPEIETFRSALRQLLSALKGHSETEVDFSNRIAEPR